MELDLDLGVSNIKLSLDYIGFFSPIIFLLLSILFLRNTFQYLTGYIIGFFINFILNYILKLFIKEPRPTQSNKIITVSNIHGLGEKYGANVYGMPSGHAQTSGYTLSYITLVLNNSMITVLFSIITIITLFQRFFSISHTILQLIIGFLLGIFMGYIMYIIIQRNIKGNIKMKRDDDAPI